MNSHNAKSDSFLRPETIRISADKEGARVLDSKPGETAALSISDDLDKGGDPYNSTGQHVIIASRLALED